MYFFSKFSKDFLASFQENLYFCRNNIFCGMRHIETAAAVGEVRGIPFVVSRIRGNSNKKRGTPSGVPLIIYHRSRINLQSDSHLSCRQAAQVP